MRKRYRENEHCHRSEKQQDSYPHRPAPLQCDFVAPHVKVKCTSPNSESRLGHGACFGHVTQTEVLKSASALDFALSFTVLWNLDSTM